MIIGHFDDVDALVERARSLRRQQERAPYYGLIGAALLCLAFWTGVMLLVVGV